MINQDVLNFIKAESAKGTSKDIIQSNLLSNGWNLKDIAEGFSTVEILKNNPNYEQPSQKPRKLLIIFYVIFFTGLTLLVIIGGIYAGIFSCALNGGNYTTPINHSIFCKIFDYVIF